MSMLGVPLSRSSALWRAAGLSFEEAVALHRALGHLMMGLLTFHAIGYMVAWLSESSEVLLDELTDWLRCEREHRCGHINNLAGLIAWLAGLLLWATSLRCFRRRRYDVFFIAHQLHFVFFGFGAIHWPAHLLRRAGRRLLHRRPRDAAPRARPRRRHCARAPRRRVGGRVHGDAARPDADAEPAGARACRRVAAAPAAAEAQWAPARRGVAGRPLPVCRRRREEHARRRAARGARRAAVPRRRARGRAARSTSRCSRRRYRSSEGSSGIRSRSPASWAPARRGRRCSCTSAARNGGRHG